MLPLDGGRPCPGGVPAPKRVVPVPGQLTHPGLGLAQVILPGWVNKKVTGPEEGFGLPLGAEAGSGAHAAATVTRGLN